MISLSASLACCLYLSHSVSQNANNDIQKPQRPCPPFMQSLLLQMPFSCHIVCIVASESLQGGSSKMQTIIFHLFNIFLWQVYKWCFTRALPVGAFLQWRPVSGGVPPKNFLGLWSSLPGPPPGRSERSPGGWHSHTVLHRPQRALADHMLKIRKK